ncbi:MAG: hypothetical protein M1371_05945 [Actinobacteria bacterium]|nr:hypothetical protein [Actinomycetota bacterium]
MKLKGIVLRGLYQSLALTVYIVFIAFVMNNLSNIFPTSHTDLTTMWQAFTVLTIFVISALITGSIVLVYPIYLVTKKMPKEAGFIVLSTVVWLILFFIISLIIALIVL